MDEYWAHVDKLMVENPPPVTTPLNDTTVIIFEVPYHIRLKMYTFRTLLVTRRLDNIDKTDKVT